MLVLNRALGSLDLQFFQFEPVAKSVFFSLKVAAYLHPLLGADELSG